MDKNKLKKEKKLENKINSKYVSPFHVPGYTAQENLWDFVCDLNEEDPLDKLIYKVDEETLKENYMKDLNLISITKKKRNTKKRKMKLKYRSDNKKTEGLDGKETKNSDKK